MSEMVTIELDLAKNLLQVYGAKTSGAAVLRGDVAQFSL